jgi:3'(2'), 5'-bisphosphate nucleotidase
MISPDFHEMLWIAIQACLFAGKVIMDAYGDAHPVVKLKSDFSPLTIADQAAHKELITHLERTNIPVISEEGIMYDYSVRSGWDLYWLVDPLDGTREFLKKNDEFTVNIALVKNNLPVIGVIYAPALGKLYFSSQESGAYLLTTAIINKEIPDDLSCLFNISEKLPLHLNKSGFTIIASRSHRNLQTRIYIHRLKKEHGKLAIISKGSSLKFCLVAEGNADIYPRFGATMEWDTAAGQAIAVHAGCSVLRYDTGEILTYNKKELKNPWFIVKR